MKRRRTPWLWRVSSRHDGYVLARSRPEAQSIYEVGVAQHKTRGHVTKVTSIDPKEQDYWCIDSTLVWAWRDARPYYMSNADYAAQLLTEIDL